VSLVLLSSCLKDKWLSLILLTLAALTGCTTVPEPAAPDVASWRAEKDRYMRESPESPVPEDQRATFGPLPYYDIDPAYSVPAALAVEPSEVVIELPTSTGQRRRMRRVGTLKFTLQGQPHTLAAFVDADTKDVRRLFVPFADLTSGSETFAGGRYIDLDRTGTGIYELDFNRAYHPFCVFNPEYDCPYPPRENRLQVPIRAGERLPAS
jgi:uncharacterized protein (DUF1684 family)